MSASNKVLVIGSFNVDIACFLDTRPQPGETIAGTSIKIGLGGKGANQAVAAARAGADTVFVGAVGDDALADVAVAPMDAAGIDLAALQRTHGETGAAHIRIDAAGENDIVIVAGANNKIETAEIFAAIESAGGPGSVLLMQLEIPVHQVVAALQAAKQQGMTTILDPAPAVALPKEVWASVDYVLPNETESARYTGTSEPAPAARWFIDHGVNTVIITLGAAGVLVMDADGTSEFSTPQVTAVDTTAAGDTFAGYFAAALAAGQPVSQAVTTATCAASLSVTKQGASESVPTSEQVAEFMRQA